MSENLISNDQGNNTNQQQKQTKNKKQKKTQLFTFFMFSIAGVFFILNLFQLVFISEKTKASIEQSYIDDCTQITEGYSAAISHLLGEYMNEMNQYVTADIIQTKDTAKITDWLRAHKNSRSKDFDYIIFCDKTGIMSTDIGTTSNITDRSYYKAIIKEGKDQFIDNPVISKTNGKPIIHITKAVKVEGKTIGFFAGVVTVDAIKKAVNEIKLGKSGYAMLLAGDGTVIAHPDNELVMKKNFLTDLKTEHSDIIKLAKEMTGSKTGSAWIKGFNGEKECAVFTPVEGTFWSFAFLVSESQVYQTANSLVKMMATTGIIILLVILIFSGIVIYKALNPLNIVETAIIEIASGNADLTKRIKIQSNNEIGSVVEGFNKFTAKLQSIVTELKGSKDVLSSAGEELKTGTQEAQAAIDQILSKIETISNSITNQSAGVEETAGAINEIASNISSLERMIETQASGVSQASAAVEQMIGNIQSVNVSTEKMAAAFISLENNAASGAEKQQAVNERIKIIENESDMLQEANSVIAGIANQTNLLAMNAAIEAAHAGEAGKGFSVVSDEIRKLSETSTAQSKTIGEQLNKINEYISNVVSASEESSAAFTAVSEGIQNTDELVKQIQNAMREQQEGSRQITDALHSMNDSTSEVRTAASEMSVGSKAILDEVKELQDSTESIQDDMVEMGKGANTIRETGTSLTTVAEKVMHSINRIEDQVDKFKV